MICSLQQARQAFASAGLFVRRSPGGLMVGSGTERVEHDIVIVHDPVTLGRDGEDWAAVFPDQCRRMVVRRPSLGELSRLVLAAYERRRTTGQGLAEAVRGLQAAA